MHVKMLDAVFQQVRARAQKGVTQFLLVRLRPPHSLLDATPITISITIIYTGKTQPCFLFATPTPPGAATRVITCALGLIASSRN